MAKFDPSTISPRKQWFDKKSEAIAVYRYRKDVKRDFLVDGVYKGVKGSRNAGRYYVGSYMQFLNIA